jgi:two-component system chemotaxis response regulator CheB
MDGLTFLEAVMAHSPTRTLVLSSLTEKNSSLALRAMEIGAIDVMTKPALDVSKSLEDAAQEIIQRVKQVASARLTNVKPAAISRSKISPTALKKISSLDRTTHQLIAIASSTGGTEALKVVLGKLPADLPGTVIVQHMPPGFTRTYAESLNKLMPFEVREAKHGDKIVPGLVLLAPGNFHMEIVRSGGFYHVSLHQEAALHGVRPAADILLNSVAKYAGKNAIGVVLTGMGRDGAKGLLAMKEAGSFNIGQDESTSVVYGMPRAAAECGALHAIKPLEDIAPLVVKHLSTKPASKSA